MLHSIQILTADKIERSKWNHCVNESENGLIYSRYEYLNYMCDNWHGLVINNYETVMALPWRKKFGTRYLYQPAFTQQLGLIGNNYAASDAVMASVWSFVKYGDLLFNYLNKDLAEKVKVVKRINLVIDLSAKYDAISSRYKKDLVANLRKAKKENLHISKEENIPIAISMYKELYRQRMRNLSDDDYLKFQSLCALLQKDRMCFTRKVEDAHGHLLAIGLFLKDSKRIYNLMNTTTENGRATEANHFLLDEVIREFSGQNLLFDFEGSDLPGVKSFYEKFGVVEQPYFHYHFNRLPKLLRLIKS